MKKGAGKRIISTGLFFEENKLLFVFITTVTFGVAAGSIISGFLNESGREAINILIKEYFDESKSSLYALFIRELSLKSAIMILLYISGLSVVGMPMILILPLIEGIRLGMLVSYQYLNSGFNGFIISLSHIAVSSALFLCLFLSVYKESFFMSLSVSNGISNKKLGSSDYNCSFFTFTKRFIIYEICICIISFLSALLTFCFGKII